MADDHIATYLNDHLAGSTAGLEILEHLQGEHAGTPAEGLLAQLYADISADRQKLEALMGELNITQSRTRKASAWVTEKLTELKLRLDDPAGGALRQFEALEALSLGIEGKKGLWQALASAAEAAPALRLLDYGLMIQRADAQRFIVEKLRLEAAKRALIPGD